MSLFDPAFNPPPSLLQPIAITPNPVPWLPTHDVAELAPVIVPTAAIPFTEVNPSDAPLAASPLGQPLGVATQSGDPVTGLAATQATAVAGGIETFDPSPVDTFSNGSSGWRIVGQRDAPIATNSAYGSFQVASVSTQPTPIAIVASNPTPLVGSSVVVSPLASPVLAPTSDPTSFMGLTPDSAVATTSEVKALARLKPISFLAGLKNSQVAKRLLSLSGARKFT
jgi:hypothetical protein